MTNLTNVEVLEIKEYLHARSLRDKHWKLIWSWLKFFFLSTIGVTIAALGLNIFLIPNHILDGGVTGISMILSHVAPFNLGIFLLVLNLPFLYIGFKNIGVRFLIKAGYSVGLYAILAVQFIGIYVVNHDVILSAIMGGIMLGLGIGLVMLSGGCTDGTEVIAILVSKKTSFSVGQIILAINIIIFTFGGFLFGVDKALYSIITYYITSKAMDIISTGLEEAKACMIITDEEDSKILKEKIYKKLGRTVTILEGSGLITGDKKLLYVVITRLELSELKNIVSDEDISAFVTITDVSEVLGKHMKKVKPEVLQKI